MKKRGRKSGMMKALFLGEDVGVWLMFAWWDGTELGSKEWRVIVYITSLML